MTIAEAKRTTRIIEWKRLIYERQRSGQSVRAWCRQNGIRENSYYYWLRIIREEALCEAESKSGALVRVESEKLAVETVSPQTTSGGIVIRAHGVETEFPSGTDIPVMPPPLLAHRDASASVVADVLMKKFCCDESQETRRPQVATFDDFLSFLLQEATSRCCNVASLTG